MLPRVRVRVACEDVCGRRHGRHTVIEWGLLWMCACSIVKNVSNDLAALEPAPQWYVLSPSGDAILSSIRSPINFKMNSEASGVQGNTHTEHENRSKLQGPACNVAVIPQFIEAGLRATFTVNNWAHVMKLLIDLLRSKASHPSAPSKFCKWNMTIYARSHTKRKSYWTGGRPSRINPYHKLTFFFFTSSHTTFYDSNSSILS